MLVWLQLEYEEVDSDCDYYLFVVLYDTYCLK